MATTLTPGVEAPVTLATTVELLTVPSSVRTLVIWESDVGVYVVTGAADAAALPSTGRRHVGTVTAGSPIEIDISAYGAVGLAGTGSGTARVEVR